MNAPRWRVGLVGADCVFQPTPETIRRCLSGVICCLRGVTVSSPGVNRQGFGNPIGVTHPACSLHLVNVGWTTRCRRDLKPSAFGIYAANVQHGGPSFTRLPARAFASAIVRRRGVCLAGQSAVRVGGGRALGWGCDGAVGRGDERASRGIGGKYPRAAARSEHGSAGGVDGAAARGGKPGGAVGEGAGATTVSVAGRRASSSARAGRGDCRTDRAVFRVPGGRAPGRGERDEPTGGETTNRAAAEIGVRERPSAASASAGREFGWERSMMRRRA